MMDVLNIIILESWFDFVKRHYHRYGIASHFKEHFFNKGIHDEMPKADTIADDNKEITLQTARVSHRPLSLVLAIWNEEGKK
jgi:hypothetical protein